MAFIPRPAPTPTPAPMPKIQPPVAPAAAPRGMIGSTAAPPAAQPPTGATNQPKPPGSQLVDYGTETIEGRIGNILKTDSQGNYTSPVVRQATDRQHQAFNARGLLNSSMAMQAGQEAAISKAIDIAAPDAATYASASEQQRGREHQSSENSADRSFRSGESALDRTHQSGENAQNRLHESSESLLNRAHELEADQRDRNYREHVRTSEQDFQLRRDYQNSVQTVNTNFQKMVDTINASDMDPADRSVAIAQAQALRDGELAYQNNLYSRMPRWQNEWLTLANPTLSGGISSITDANQLANIANDPAQPIAVRQEAQTRMMQMTTAPAPAPAQWGMVGAPFDPNLIGTPLDPNFVPAGAQAGA